jgi:thioredoxin reductase
MFRLSGDEFIEGGRGVEESKQIAVMLAGQGVDAFHVSAGTHAANHPSGTVSIEPMAYEQGWKIYLAEEIKKAVDVPVIAVGVIREPDFAEEILALGKADFVALGRGLIADPNWADKTRSGREKGIRKCISCNEGCIRRRAFMDLPVRCTVNAEVGKLPRFRASPITGNPKRILVVGGGPGGMEAARVSKMRGHDVTLWEKRDVLGGQLVFAGVPPFKRKLHWFLDYLRGQLDELSVPCELEKEATPANVLEFNPDELIIATGAVPNVPSIPGIDGPYVKSPEEVLVEDYSGNGGKVVVMGGGAKGAEVGLFLSERGETVTIVEMLDGIALDMDLISRRDLLSRLEAQGVTLLTRARIVSCEDRGVNVVLNGGKKAVIEGEKLILSLGYRCVDQLENNLKGKVPRIHCIGDCREPRKAIDAVSEAYTIATQM